jgi:S-adenosylmethionine:tRNA ribosyltransferase-isomerase
VIAAMQAGNEGAQGSGFTADDLEYALPDALIAQSPPAERDAGRLLCMRRGGGELVHARVRELPELLPPSLIVVNDTRVLAARLLARKPTGGKVELLLVERLSPPGAHERWLALARGKGLRAGTRLEFAGGALVAELGERRDQQHEVVLAAQSGTVAQAIAAVGQVPLPPYIRRAPEPADTTRYQTVYATHDGAVAAPTAGLHLSERLLQRLAAGGHELVRITLHVGPGTFAPLRSAELSGHLMHPERYSVPQATADAVASARARGRKVLAIGTTVVRALESAADEGGGVRAGEGSTALFIYPPYRFRVVDALLTNFHLPRSTLLALVMAFGGVAEVRAAYGAAVEAGYRFYSYGDAMLIRSAP